MIEEEHEMAGIAGTHLVAQAGKAPERCPVCAHPQSDFEINAENH